MGGIFGGGKSNSTTEPVIASVQIQTSAYGGIVPVVVGSRRIAANIIQYEDFTAIPHTTTQQTGKGGGGSTQTNTSFTYTANVIMGICSGPASVLTCFRDKDIFSPGDVLWTFTIKPGTESQTPWTVMTSKHPTRALGYGGICYAAAPNLDLGSNATMKNHNFHVVAGPAGGIVSSIATTDPKTGLPTTMQITEYNPMDVLPFVTSDASVGMGWPVNTFEPTTLANAKLYCQQTGLIGAWAWIDAAPGIQQLTELFYFANCAPVLSGGQIKVIPYADTAIGSWFPNSTPVYALTVDDFLGPEDEPVKIEITPLEETFNRLTAQYCNASLGFVDDTVTVEDMGDQDMFSLRVGQGVTIKGAIRPEVAQQVALLGMQRNLLVRCKYMFKLGWKFALLEGMDLVTLYVPSLSPAGVVVRIKLIEENEDGEFEVTAEDWPTGVSTAVAYPNTGGEGTGSVRNIDPGNTDTPFIFEPPGDLTNWSPQVWVGAYGQSLDWGGCNIWVSRDNTSYSQVGQILAPARLGRLTTSSMAYTPPPLDPTLDTGSLATVDLSLSRGELIPVSALDCDRYVTLAAIGETSSPATFELLSYQNAALAGSHTYTLSRFRRGLFGTAAQATSHGVGAYFLRLDEAVAVIDTSRWNIGDLIYIKLQSFNTYQNMAQDITLLSPTVYTLVGNSLTGVAPSTLTLAITPTVPV